MADDCVVARQMKDMQERAFRIAGDPRRYGMSLSAISKLSGIPYNTLRSYAGHNGETAIMPVTTLWKLKDVLPDEILCLLMPAVSVEDEDPVDSAALKSAAEVLAQITTIIRDLGERA